MKSFMSGTEDTIRIQVLALKEFRLIGETKNKHVIIQHKSTKSSTQHVTCLTTFFAKAVFLAETGDKPDSKG